MANGQMQDVSPSLVDPKSGLCTVYDLVAKKYRKVRPVDAREMVKVGSATFEGPEGVKAPEAEKEPDANKEPYDFTKHNVEQLRTFAERAGVREHQSLKKGDLIAALEAAKFYPGDEDLEAIEE